MNTNEAVAVLINIHTMFTALHDAAEADNRPTAITMSLKWLCDDTLKIIADLDPRFVADLED